MSAISTKRSKLDRRTAISATEPGIFVPEDAPWPEPVGGVGLLRDAEAFFTRYVVLPKGVPLVVSAWALTTYLMDAFDAHPILAVTSPEKQCGKTRLLEVLEQLVLRPIRTPNLSAASLFRLIAEAGPTLLIDEAQNLRSRDERSAALHDLLCAGNRRGSSAIRVGGPNRDTLQQFPVFGPKVLACIGNLSEIIVDRAIEVRMRRRLLSEKVDRFFHKVAESQAKPLHRKIVRWAREHQAKVLATYRDTSPPDFLADRAAENWMPLFALVEVADSSRLPELFDAARAMHASGKQDGYGVRVLADIRAVFEEHDTDFLSTLDLLEELLALPESPWCDWRNGRQLTDEALANLLRQFDIRSEQVRRSGKRVRGYSRQRFVDAWARYLPSSTRDTRDNAGAMQPSGDSDTCVNPSATQVQDAAQSRTTPELSQVAQAGSADGGNDKQVISSLIVAEIRNELHKAREAYSNKQKRTLR